MIRRRRPCATHPRGRLRDDQVRAEPAGQALDTLRAESRPARHRHVDLWLIHWPGDGAPTSTCGARSSRRAQAGLARDIGVSNFGVEHDRRASRPRRTSSRREPDRVEPAALRRRPWSTRIARAASRSRATAPCAAERSTTRPFDGSPTPRTHASSGHHPLASPARHHRDPKSRNADRIRSNAPRPARGRRTARLDAGAVSASGCGRAGRRWRRRRRWRCAAPRCPSGPARRRRWRTRRAPRR